MCEHKVEVRVALGKAPELGRQPREPQGYWHNSGRMLKNEMEFEYNCGFIGSLTNPTESCLTFLKMPRSFLWTDPIAQVHSLPGRYFILCCPSCLLHTSQF